MLNYAICTKSDERFLKDNIYECSCCYRGFVDILDNNNELIKTTTNDDNFIFIFNIIEELKEVLENKYTKISYKEIV